MKHIEETLNLDIQHISLLYPYLENKPFAILDIETTGLSPAYNSVILVGLIIVDSVGSQTMHQFFAVNPEDEKDILSSTIDTLKNVEYIITFNGRSFDIPFLQKRISKANLEPLNVFNLDLFLLIKNYSPLSKLLPRLNQKSLEEYLGISNMRQDRISGGESVDLYSSYLVTGSRDLERRILLHNSDDVKQLLRLMELSKHVEIDRAFYNSGFPIAGGQISGITLKKEELIISGVSDNPIEYIAFPTIESPYTFRMSASTGEFELELPLDNVENNTFVNSNGLIEADSTLKNMPYIVDDYIIFRENGTINHLAINLLSKELMNRLLKSL